MRLPIRFPTTWWKWCWWQWPSSTYCGGESPLTLVRKPESFSGGSRIRVTTRWIWYEKELCRNMGVLDLISDSIHALKFEEIWICFSRFGYSRFLISDAFWVEGC